MKRLSRLVYPALIALAAGALIQQLRRPGAQRTWTGQVLGVPYDFRMPTFRRAESRWWNPNDRRLLTPKTFGLGWDVNLYQVKQLITSRIK